MAIQVDLSQPLTEEQIEDLRSRLPESLVQHYIAQANGEFESGGDTGEDEDKKPAAKRTAAKKDDGDILK